MSSEPRVVDNIVRHILLGKFHPETTVAQFDEIIRRFYEMADKIPGILTIEHGTNNSSEGKDLDITEVIIVTFRDKAARDAYLLNPAHIQFSSWLGEQNLIENLVIVDFMPQTLNRIR